METPTLVVLFSLAIVSSILLSVFSVFQISTLTVSSGVQELARISVSKVEASMYTLITLALSDANASSLSVMVSLPLPVSITPINDSYVRISAGGVHSLVLIPEGVEMLMDGNVTSSLVLLSYEEGMLKVDGL